MLQGEKFSQNEKKIVILAEFLLSIYSLFLYPFATFRFLAVGDDFPDVGA